MIANEVTATTVNKPQAEPKSHFRQFTPRNVAWSRIWRDLSKFSRVFMDVAAVSQMNLKTENERYEAEGRKA